MNKKCLALFGLIAFLAASVSASGAKACAIGHCDTREFYCVSSWTIVPTAPSVFGTCTARTTLGPVHGLVYVKQGGELVRCGLAYGKSC